ncbi:MAG: hypothetical protein QXP36_00415 [Conexivisphaerales archaeon]
MKEHKDNFRIVPFILKDFINERKSIIIDALGPDEQRLSEFIERFKSDAMIHIKQIKEDLEGFYVDTSAVKNLCYKEFEKILKKNLKEFKDEWSL